MMHSVAILFLLVLLLSRTHPTHADADCKPISASFSDGKVARLPAGIVIKSRKRKRNRIRVSIVQKFRSPDVDPATCPNSVETDIGAKLMATIDTSNHCKGHTMICEFERSRRTLFCDKDTGTAKMQARLFVWPPREPISVGLCVDDPLVDVDKLSNDSHESYVIEIPCGVPICPIGDEDTRIPTAYPTHAPSAHPTPGETTAPSAYPTLGAPVRAPFEPSFIPAPAFLLPADAPDFSCTYSPKPISQINVGDFGIYLIRSFKGSTFKPDLFRQTSNPDYATGTMLPKSQELQSINPDDEPRFRQFSDSSQLIQLGGDDDVSIKGISGGFVNTFDIPDDTNVQVATRVEIEVFWALKLGDVGPNIRLDAMIDVEGVDLSIRTKSIVTTPRIKGVMGRIRGPGSSTNLIQSFVTFKPLANQRRYTLKVGGFMNRKNGRQGLGQIKIHFLHVSVRGTVDYGVPCESNDDCDMGLYCASGQCQRLVSCRTDTDCFNPSANFFSQGSGPLEEFFCNKQATCVEIQECLAIHDPPFPTVCTPCDAPCPGRVSCLEVKCGPCPTLNFDSAGKLLTCGDTMPVSPPMDVPSISVPSYIPPFDAPAFIYGDEPLPPSIINLANIYEYAKLTNFIVYQDDLFRQTDNPNYADGIFLPGLPVVDLDFAESSPVVQLGGDDDVSVTGISGGFVNTIVMPSGSIPVVIGRFIEIEIHWSMMLGDVGPDINLEALLDVEGFNLFRLEGEIATNIPLTGGLLGSIEGPGSSTGIVRTKLYFVPLPDKKRYTIKVGAFLNEKRGRQGLGKFRIHQFDSLARRISDLSEPCKLDDDCGSDYYCASGQCQSVTTCRTSSDCLNPAGRPFGEIDEPVGALMCDEDSKCVELSECTAIHDPPLPTVCTPCDAPCSGRASCVKVKCGPCPTLNFDSSGRTMECEG